MTSRPVLVSRMCTKAGWGLVATWILAGSWSTGLGQGIFVQGPQVEVFHPDWERMGVRAEDARKLDAPAIRDLIARQAGDPPQGTAVFRHRDGGVWVRSTVEYLSRVTELLPQNPPRPIYLSIRAVLFEVKDWPPPDRDPTRPATLEEILAVPAERRRVVGDLHLIAEHNMNAQAQDVAERIYSVDMRPARNPSEKAVMELLPVFETREVGHILNVTPTLGADGETARLTMAWESTEEAAQIAFPWLDPKAAAMAMPLFVSQRLTTNLEVRLGTAVVLHLSAAGTAPQLPALNRPPREAARMLVIRVDSAEE